MSQRPDILGEYRVRIIPAERAGPQPKYPANLGRRTKFGGLPDAIQAGDEEQKRCPDCFAPMHFVAQIDSFEFNGENNPNCHEHEETHFVFGDVGMIYVWFWHGHAARPARPLSLSRLDPRQAADDQGPPPRPRPAGKVEKVESAGTH
jgi:hypothetical protein